MSAILSGLSHPCICSVLQNLLEFNERPGNVGMMPGDSVVSGGGSFLKGLEVFLGSDYVYTCVPFYARNTYMCSRYVFMSIGACVLCYKGVEKDSETACLLFPSCILLKIRQGS